MEHVSWLAHEYVSLQALRVAGVKVPGPIAFANNTILMEYFGDVKHPAPPLQGVTLERAEARRLFDALIGRHRDDVEQRARARGPFSVQCTLLARRLPDHRLSAVGRPSRTSAAFPLFERDVVRICQYFSRYGILTDGPALARSIWERHMSEL